ncbi:helix-turn-helix transcriptional regulator [Enterobacter bugandensis]|uniref:helix-turn-helix transcriptional regulator n=1 Tax=Enterobacter bugandensis TaxID=881260 RepID=UPI002A7F1856|nr:PAS domain-containing protein [Enterobacter bugandensis]
METLKEPCGIKDNRSVFMYANNAYLELLNLPGKFNIEGLLDSDVPAETARYASLFQQHDRLVEQTGERRSSLEIHRFGKERQLSAYFFDKTPFPNEKGEITGTFFHGRRAIHLPFDFYLSGENSGSLLLTRPDNLFTDFEWLVVFFIKNHRSQKEIAHTLGHSPGYIKNTIARIYEKSGVNSAKMLVEYLHANNWHNYVPEQLLAYRHIILP